MQAVRTVRQENGTARKRRGKKVAGEMIGEVIRNG
jgi:hypothetical protein